MTWLYNLERQLLWRNLRERLNSCDKDSQAAEVQEFDEDLIMQALMQWSDLPYNKKRSPYRLDS